MNRSPVTARQLTRNLTAIKDGIPDSFDRIVDYLVEKEVLQLNVKQELAAIHKMRDKIDFLLQRVTRQGNNACDMFVTAMERNGLRQEAEKIRLTCETTSKLSPERASAAASVSKRSSKHEMQYSSEECSQGHTSQSRIPRLDLASMQRDTTTPHSRHQDPDLEDKFRELAVQNETFRRDLETRLTTRLDDMQQQRDDLQQHRDDLQKEQDKIRKDRKKMKRQFEDQQKDMEMKFNNQRYEMQKEQDKLQKERRKLRKENEKLQTANIELNEKVNALENEFKSYRDKSDKDIAGKDREIENLRTQNDKLRRDLDNLKQRVCAETDLHQDQTQQILQTVAEVDERDARIDDLKQISKTERASPRASTARGRQLPRTSPLPPIQEARPRETSSVKSAKSKRWQSTF